jgi:hypothetical protein
MEEARGVPPGGRIVGVLGGGAAKLLGVAGVARVGVAEASVGDCPEARAVLFLLIWFVISFLNCSRSAVATGVGLVNVNVWPSGNE